MGTLAITSLPFSQSRRTTAVLGWGTGGFSAVPHAGRVMGSGTIGVRLLVSACASLQLVWQRCGATLAACAVAKLRLTQNRRGGWD